MVDPNKANVVLPPPTPSPLCSHQFELLDSATQRDQTATYRFFCKKCLAIVDKQAPIIYDWTK